jgi:hypothetical protein
MPARKNSSSDIPTGYVHLEGSERRPSPQATLVGPTDENETFTATIVLRRRQDGPPVPDFDHFLNTPLKHRRRLPEKEFSANYGAHPDDIDAVVEFARSENLDIIDTNSSRRTVLVSGTAAQISAAFAAPLALYRHSVYRGRGKASVTETYRGRDGFIAVPKNLAEVIVGVFGLDNRNITLSNGNPGDPPNVGYLNVQTVAGLYNFPTNTASGQVIGIASPSSIPVGFLQSDITLSFENQMPPVNPPTITQISVDGTINTAAQGIATASNGTALTLGSVAGNIVAGAYPSSPTIAFGTNANPATVAAVVTAGGTTTVTLSQAVAVPVGTVVFFDLTDPTDETTQDINIAALAAPEAQVAVYFSQGDQQGWVDLINRAVNPEPGEPICNVLSSSYFIAGGDDPYGLGLYGVSTSFVDAMHAALQDAAIQGMTVCIAAGDRGSNNVGKYLVSVNPNVYIGDGKQHVQFPASDPWVLTVGGTTVGTNASNQAVEYVWNDPSPSDPGQWGTTGGGVSAYFPQPSYQPAGLVPPTLNTDFSGFLGRGIPDVAANASFQSGFNNLYFGNSLTPGSGTSASSPFWAGLIAVLNAALGENVGFVNPLIYQIGATQDSTAFNPINLLSGQVGPTNNGNNGIAGYPAGPGWDACTGWGSPNGKGLLAAIQQYQQLAYFIIDQPIFEQGAVETLLVGSSTADYEAAFYIVVEGFSPNQLNIGTAANLSNPPVANLPSFSPQPPSGMTFGFTKASPSDTTLWSTNPAQPQRITYEYSIQFSSGSNPIPFPNPPGVTDLFVTATINSVTGSQITTNVIFQLSSAPVSAPIFVSSSGVSWLSSELKVFQIDQSGEWKFQSANGLTYAAGVVFNDTGNPTADATSFIQSVIQSFNGGNGGIFDQISTSEDAEQLDNLPTDPSTGNPVYNFAIARVSYNPGALLDAQSVRVFFRLIPALNTSTAFDTLTNYRQWSDDSEYGRTVPLLGFDPDPNNANNLDVMTIPFFASPRVDVTQASMTTQTDEPNVQTIDGSATGVVDAYFGCWLDINQTTTPQFPVMLPTSAGNLDGPYTGSLVPISSLIFNIHECIVAEISFDPAPIALGAVPTFTGPLAQRNLSIVSAANPGHESSRLVPNTFIVRPTSPLLEPGQRPDELLIDWGNTPVGSVASIYWPSVDADKVVQLASVTYGSHGLKATDSHTVSLHVGGISYIPIPPGTKSNYFGLVSVDLPYGIRKGQSFDIAVRQVTSATHLRENAFDVKLPDYRRVLGSFQIKIAVSVKEKMLETEERLLSLLRWTERTLPPTSGWYPVFKRYVSQIADRVEGLGGNPNAIAASPTGVVKSKSHANGTFHANGTSRHEGVTSTGKISGLKYDRFGDFQGFFLDTEEGAERWYVSHEEEIEELADKAWNQRAVISVIGDESDEHRPATIILRQPH